MKNLLYPALALGLLLTGLGGVKADYNGGFTSHAVRIDDGHRMVDHDDVIAKHPESAAFGCSWDGC